MPFQTQYSYFAPTRLVVGRGSLQEIPGILAEKGARKALVVTDAGLVSAGLVSLVTDLLDGAGAAYAVYDGVVANPPIRVVQEGIARYGAEGCDHLIAIGGGSSMDVAKAVGVVATNGGKVEDYFGVGKMGPRVPFLLCVPTTYGTASEVTPFAVITDDAHYKSALVGPQIIPDVGVLDADMAVGLPMPIAAATGMDALTHAVESYTSLGSNGVSEGIALHAIRLISRHLRQAASSSHDHEAAEQMLVGSTLAGIAFSQSRLGNVHAMSHPVSGHYDVAHGVANAILLTRVMAFNRVACAQRFADIAVAMGEDVEGLSPMEAATCAVTAVETLGSDVGIPANLTAVGVPADGIPTLADDSMKSPNIQINPRTTTRDDVVAIFQQAM